MREKRGWFLPEDDGYFDTFLESAGGYKRNGFQRDHLMVALSYVRDWSLAVDAGAHVGFWALDMAARFKQVHCFEAAPDTYKCLMKNLEDLPNVTTHHIALGHESGSVTIHEREKRRKGTNSPHQSGSRWVKPEQFGGTVAMRTLDSYALPSCGFMKIDVEGFEEFVLRGAKHLIKQFRPVIIMENEKKGFSENRYGTSWLEPVNFLMKRDYVNVWYARPNRVYIHREMM